MLVGTYVHVSNSLAKFIQRISLCACKKSSSKTM